MVAVTRSCYAPSWQGTMYLQHFGLREAPFGVASDRRFTFFGKEHREAISSLYVGILEGRGISATP